MRKTQTVEWFSQFKSGEMSAKDCVRSGCPSTDCTDEHAETAKSSTKTDEVPFRRSMAGQAFQTECACESSRRS